LPELQIAENQILKEGVRQGNTAVLWHLIQSGQEKTQRGGAQASENLQLLDMPFRLVLRADTTRTLTGRLLIHLYLFTDTPDRLDDLVCRWKISRYPH
jgi:hypothetical protein